MKALVKDKIYGAVTVGERGQIVIPAQIRRSFKINSGDKMIIFAKHEMIGLVSAQEFNRFLDEATKAVARISKEN